MTDNNTPPSGTPPNPLDVLSSMTPPPAAEPVDAAAQASLNQALTGMNTSTVASPIEPQTSKETPAVSGVEPEVVVESAFTALTPPQVPQPESGPMPIPTVTTPTSETLTLTEHPIDAFPAAEPASAMPLPSINDTPQPMPQTPTAQPAVPAEMPTTTPIAAPLPTDPKELEKKAEELIGKPKKKISPKVKIAAAGMAMLVLAGGIAFTVLGPVRQLATTKSVTSKDASACTWVVTSCGSGCADNKDLYNCNSYKKDKKAYVDKSTVGKNADSDAKATTGCNLEGNCGFEKAPDEVINQINPDANKTTNSNNTENKNTIVAGTAIWVTCNGDPDPECKCAGGGVRCGSVCAKVTSVAECGGVEAIANTVNPTLYTCVSGNEDPNGGCQQQPISWSGGINAEPVCGVDVPCGSLWQIDSSTGFKSGRCTCATTNTATTEDTSSEETPPPTLPPDKNLACVNLTSTLTAPKIGDTVTFSCNATSQNIAIASYEFRYKIDNGAWTDLTQTSTSSKTSKALKVTAAGTYTTQCRACTAGNVCTPWSNTN